MTGRHEYNTPTPRLRRGKRITDWGAHGPGDGDRALAVTTVGGAWEFRPARRLGVLPRKPSRPAREKCANALSMRIASTLQRFDPPERFPLGDSLCCSYVFTQSPEGNCHKNIGSVPYSNTRSPSDSRHRSTRTI